MKLEFPAGPVLWALGMLAAMSVPRTAQAQETSNRRHALPVRMEAERNSRFAPVITPAASETIRSGPPETVESAAASEAWCSNCNEPCESCAPGGLFHGRWKAWMQRTHWGYPEEFCEIPLGTHLRSASQIHVRNGVQAQMVVYSFDFQMAETRRTARLKPQGLRRVARMADWLGRGEAPIVVEQDDSHSKLNEARRQAVVAALAEFGIPDADKLVVLGRPAAPGMDADEAIRVQEAFLQHARSGGGLGAPAASGYQGSGAGMRSFGNGSRGSSGSGY